jgi:hypothetical protein
MSERQLPVIPPKAVKKVLQYDKLGKWKNERLNLCGQRQVLQPITERRGEFDRY